MDKKYRRLLTGGIMAMIVFVLMLVLLPDSTTAALDATYINGYVKDKDTNSGIGEVTISILDPETGRIETWKTEENGFYNISSFGGTAIPKGHYSIHAAHQDYKSSSLIVNRTRGHKNLKLEKIDMTGVPEENRTVTINISARNSDVLTTEGYTTPIQNAEVYLIDMNGTHDGVNIFGNPSPHILKGKTPKDSWISFENIPNSTYKAMVVYQDMLTYHVIKATDDSWDWDENLFAKKLYLSREENNLTLSIEVNKELEPGVTEGIGDFQALIIFDELMIMKEDRDNTLLYLNKGLDDSEYHVYVNAQGYKAEYKNITAAVNGAPSKYVSVEFVLDPYDYGIPMSNASVTFQTMNDTKLYRNDTRAFDMGTSFTDTFTSSMMTGIFRGDIAMNFGDSEANYINWQDVQLGSDGYSVHGFMKIREDGGYQMFDINTNGYTKTTTLEAGIEGNITTFESYDASVDIPGDQQRYTLRFELFHYMVDVYLPDGYEFTFYEEDGVEFIAPENDTTWFSLKGTGEIEVTIEENMIPEIIVDIPDDLVTTDELYVVKLDAWVVFNATESSDDIIDWTWKFEQDDETMVAENYTVEANHSFDFQGNVTVNLTVVDTAGGVNWWEFSVVVDGTPPEVLFDIEDNIWNDTAERPFILQKIAGVEENKYRFTLNATNTTDPKIDDIETGLYNYSWDFGDGENTLSGKSPDGANISATHWYDAINTTFYEAGVGYYYNITLTVWDKAGNKDVSTLQKIYINDTEKPVAVFEIPDTVIKDEEFNLSAYNSTDNVAIVSYNWTFGYEKLDAANYYNTTAPNITFDKYNRTDFYTITLTVFDEKGNNDSHQLVIEVEDPKGYDLSAENIEVSNLEPEEGDIIEIKVKISNIGFMEFGNLTGNVTIYIGGTEDEHKIETKDIPEIAKDGSVNVTFDWKVKGDGPTTIYAKLEDLVDDLDPTNNENQKNIDIKKEGDEFPLMLIIGIVVIAVLVIVAAWYLTNISGMKPLGSKKSSLTGVKKKK